MTSFLTLRTLPARTDVELFASKYGVDPDDLYQEATVRVLSSAGPTNPRLKSHWLRVVVRNAAVSMLRARAPETSVDFLEHSLTDDMSPPIIAQQTERAELLVAAVRSLKPMDFQVLNEFYCNHKRIKQIAEESETPIGTIKRRLHVARKRLAAKLDGLC